MNEPVSARCAAFLGLREATHRSVRLCPHSQLSLPRKATVSKTLGIILIVLGLVGLAWGGFTYTTREKVIDIGPIHATREKTHKVPLAPIGGALALIGGIVILAAGKKGTP